MVNLTDTGDSSVHWLHLQVLRQLGYTSLLLQIGRGQYEPETMELSDQSPAVQFYRFKDSIADDIAAADLVICHAGKCGLMRSEFKFLTHTLVKV